MSFTGGATGFLRDYTFGLALTGLGVSVLGLLWALYWRDINTWALATRRWGAVQGVTSKLTIRVKEAEHAATHPNYWIWRLEGYSLADTQLSDDSIAEDTVH